MWPQQLFGWELYTITYLIFLLSLVSKTNHSNYSLYQMLEDVSPEASWKAKDTIPVQIIYVFFKMLPIMEIVLWTEREDLPTYSESLQPARTLLLTGFLVIFQCSTWVGYDWSTAMTSTWDCPWRPSRNCCHRDEPTILGTPKWHYLIEET